MRRLIPHVRVTFRHFSSSWHSHILESAGPRWRGWGRSSAGACWDGCCHGNAVRCSGSSRGCWRGGSRSSGGPGGGGEVRGRVWVRRTWLKSSTYDFFFLSRNVSGASEWFSPGPCWLWASVWCWSRPPSANSEPEETQNQMSPTCNIPQMFTIIQTVGDWIHHFFMFRSAKKKDNIRPKPLPPVQPPCFSKFFNCTV